jgi:hypothetical protein
MGGPNILRCHIVELLTRTKPQPSEVGVHDLVELCGSHIMAWLCRTVYA